MSGLFYVTPPDTVGMGTPVNMALVLTYGTSNNQGYEILFYGANGNVVTSWCFEDKEAARDEAMIILRSKIKLHQYKRISK